MAGAAAGRDSSGVDLMARKPSIVETCPTCSVQFIIAPIHERGRTPYKVCPEGHETPLPVLAKNRGQQPAAPARKVPKWKSVAPASVGIKHFPIRAKQAPAPVVPNPVEMVQEKSVLLRAREVGILGQKASESMALAAMIGCYEQLKATTPTLSHGVIDGVFEKTVKVSREILGVA